MSSMPWPETAKMATMRTRTTAKTTEPSRQRLLGAGSPRRSGRRCGLGFRACREVPRLREADDPRFNRDRSLNRDDQNVFVCEELLHESAAVPAEHPQTGTAVIGNGPDDRGRHPTKHHRALDRGGLPGFRLVFAHPELP